MNDPVSGFQYLLSGFNLMMKPGLKRFVMMPILINLLLFIGLFFLLGHYITLFNHWFAEQVPAWLTWLGVLIWIIFVIGFFLIFIYTFVTMANLIASPFNSLLSEKVEEYLTGVKAPDQSLLSIIKDTPRVLGRQLAIFAYYLPRVCLILLLFLIPVVHFVAGILWFLFSAWFMAMTFIDYPADNHRIPLAKIRAWLPEKRWVILGFGVSTLVFTMIPFINCVAIPAAVAGGTKLWLAERN